MTNVQRQNNKNPGSAREMFPRYPNMTKHFSFITYFFWGGGGFNTKFVLI